jgi:RND family efflux transporter MFP subunit
MRYISLGAILVLAGVLGAGCHKKETADGQAGGKPMGTPITVVQASAGTVAVTQEAIGAIESKAAPFVVAETPGQVKKMFVDVGQEVEAGQPMAQLDTDNLSLEKRAAEAEVNRLAAVIENQERSVERLKKMAIENFVNRAMVDDAQSQLKALTEQSASARARLARVESDLGKTTITSPARARVEQRLADVGDFMSAGRPIFRIASVEFLRVVLPFPETVAADFSPGLKVELSSPSSPDKTVAGRVAEIRPMISAGARAVELILDVPNPGGWKPGGAVKGIVTLLERHGAVMAPEPCVVLRPAGAVVYIVEGGVATQRVVRTGERQKGMVEILSGLKAGELVAMDGAGYLTDKAPVAVREGK